jgi:hypothetical protein
LVGGGLGEDAKALVDAATFCNHPMVYLVPGFHPTNVDNIKRNDFAVACFLSFTFGRLIRPNMARRAFERDPVFSAALAIQKAAHLQRIAGLGGKAQAASGQLAAKAAAGGKAQAASGQLAAKAAAGRKAQAASRQLAAKAAAADGDAPADGRYMRWSEEETAYLLQMVEKHGQKWTRILKEDGKDGGAKKFADGLTARQLLDKYGGLNRKTKPGARKTKPRAAAAEATDHA